MLTTKYIEVRFISDRHRILLEQNQMEIEDQLYHLYVHAMLVSSIELILEMYNYIYFD